MNLTAKINQKGTFTIPKFLRDAWNIEVGDLVDIEIRAVFSRKTGVEKLRVVE